MPDLRKSTSEDRLAIKALVRQGLSLYGGGEYFQGVTRVKAAQLSRYHTPEHDDKHCPIDVILDLELEIGKPIVSEYILKRQGFGTHRIEPAEFSVVPMIAKLAKLHRQFAEMTETIAEAGADDHYDRVEVAASRAQIAEMKAALDALDSRLAHEGERSAGTAPVRPVRMVGGQRNG